MASAIFAVAIVAVLPTSPEIVVLASISNVAVLEAAPAISAAIVLAPVTFNVPDPVMVISSTVTVPVPASVNVFAVSIAIKADVASAALKTAEPAPMVASPSTLMVIKVAAAVSVTAPERIEPAAKLTVVVVASVPAKSIAPDAVEPAAIFNTVTPPSASLLFILIVPAKTAALVPSPIVKVATLVPELVASDDNTTSVSASTSPLICNVESPSAAVASAIIEISKLAPETGDAF